MNFEQVINSIGIFASKHKPEILIGVGIAGLLTSSVANVIATKKTLESIDEYKKVNEIEHISKKEVVKIAWKPFLPNIILSGVSTLCIVNGVSINNKRNAALVTAYTLSETALKTYKEKVIETIGEKKERKISDEIDADKVKNNPVSSQVMIMTDKGNTLCYDSYSGRYFTSDISHLKQIEVQLNRRLMYENYISLNDLYYELRLDHITMGDELGWHTDKLPMDGLEFRYSSCLAENQEPCLVLSYNIAPKIY